jgi:hypothetical protein
MKDRTDQKQTQTGRKEHAPYELIPFEVISEEGRKEVFMTEMRVAQVRQEQRVAKVVKSAKVVGRFVGKYGKETLVVIGMAVVFVVVVVINFFQSFSINTSAPTPTRKVPFDDWDDDKPTPTNVEQGQINIVNNSGTVNVHQTFNNNK